MAQCQKNMKGKLTSTKNELEKENKNPTQKQN